MRHNSMFGFRNKLVHYLLTPHPLVWFCAQTQEGAISYLYSYFMLSDLWGLSRKHSIYGSSKHCMNHSRVVKVALFTNNVHKLFA